MSTAPDLEAPVIGDPLIDLFVWGRPARQGSNKFLGAGRVSPDDAMLYYWRERVATAVRRQWGRRPQLPDKTAVVVSAVFHVPRPATAARYRLWPVTDRDVDKYLRACLDALAPTSTSHPGAGVIANDSRVVAASATKVYADAEPGMHVRLWALPPGFEKERWVPAFEPRFVPVDVT